MIRKLAAAAVLALVFAAPSTASAYWPYMGYGGFGGYGWGFNQATNYVPSPPYYSIYPPVYYGPNITARHYGASPYAWYAGMEPITYVPQPEPAAAPEPVIIENPYVKSAKTTSAKAAAGKIEPQPLKIANPFAVAVAQ